jgi:hypothetical protein
VCKSWFSEPRSLSWVVCVLQCLLRSVEMHENDTNEARMTRAGKRENGRRIEDVWTCAYRHQYWTGTSSKAAHEERQLKPEAERKQQHDEDRGGVTAAKLQTLSWRIVQSLIGKKLGAHRARCRSCRIGRPSPPRCVLRLPRVNSARVRSRTARPSRPSARQPALVSSASASRAGGNWMATRQFSPKQWQNHNFELRLKLVTIFYYSNQLHHIRATPTVWQTNLASI